MFYDNTSYTTQFLGLVWLLPENGKNFKPASVNTSRIPKKKLIGEGLVWVAQELQKLTQNSRVNYKNFNSPASHVHKTKPIQTYHFCANLIKSAEMVRVSESSIVLCR